MPLGEEIPLERGRQRGALRYEIVILPLLSIFIMRSYTRYTQTQANNNNDNNNKRKKRKEKEKYRQLCN